MASFAAKLQAIAPTAAQRPQLERAHAQMLGARDQVADAVRRLPGEAGALYHEDIERLEQAVAALDRLVAKWDAT